jgi:hypothetical protein
MTKAFDPSSVEAATGEIETNLAGKAWAKPAVSRLPAGFAQGGGTQASADGSGFS